MVMSGRMVKAPSGYEAFLPNPLPPNIEWNQQLAAALSNADQAIGRLAAEGGKLPNPHVMIHPFVTREAVLSSRIEGTQATVGEMLADEAGVAVGRDQHDMQEVKNYVVALEYGIQRLKELPMSLRLIKELHWHLMQGVRGHHATPGEFRKTQNWIGRPGSTLQTATYVPPSVDELTPCLGDLELFLHNRQLPSLIHIALCHYQFEAIHPFLDGNGRVGRLLITLLLIEWNILPSPLLYLSAFFEATRNDYYHYLTVIRTQSAWNEWLIYFLNGVATQAKDVIQRAEQINHLIEGWKTAAVEKSAGINAIRAIEILAGNPYTTIKGLSEKIDVAPSTASTVIDKLIEIGALKQVNNQARNKVFCSNKLLAILEEPTIIM